MERKAYLALRRVGIYRYISAGGKEYHRMM